MRCVTLQGVTLHGAAFLYTCCLLHLLETGWVARRGWKTWRTPTAPRTATRARLASQGTPRKFTALLERVALQWGTLQRGILQRVSKVILHRVTLEGV